MEPVTGAPALENHTNAELLAEFKKLLVEDRATIEAMAKKAAKDGAEAAAAEYGERVVKLETRMGEIARRTSRPPGAAGFDGAAAPLTLGQQFVMSEQFKALDMGGRGARVGSSFRVRLEMRTGPVSPVSLEGHAPGVPGATPLVAPPPVTEGGSGLYIYPRRVAWVQPPTFPLVMRDLFDVIPLTGTNAVEYVIETWTSNVDYQVTEGTRKAQSGVAYSHNTAMVRTIAHFTKVSKQMLADVPFVQTTIDQRMVYEVLKKEDREILYGDNTAGHLWGVMPQATVWAAPPAIATLVTTLMDAVASAITQIALNGYIATAIVMNPADWAGLQLAKTTLGTYILQGPGYGPPQQVSDKTLWGLPVVTSINMNAGDFLVGAFPGNAAIFDREQAIVEISFENEDDFVNNLATIRCEERVTFALYVPLAFVAGKTATPFLAPAREAGPPAKK